MRSKKQRINFSIITLFPEMFEGVFNHSIIGRAIKNKKIDIHILNLRDFGEGKRKTVDDTPYGGGAGMILRTDIMDKAIQKAKSDEARVVLLTPQGKPYSQKKAKELSSLSDIVLVCGHYEGFDERVNDFVDEEISIGDYVLTGGEIPAMVVIDSVSRLLPGVLGGSQSPEDDSFSSVDFLLEYPQYTKPEEYKGEKVPSVLLSGDHKKIKEWRMEQAIKRTKKRRPDLFR